MTLKNRIVKFKFLLVLFKPNNAVRTLVSNIISSTSLHEINYWNYWKLKICKFDIFGTEKHRQRSLYMWLRNYMTKMFSNVCVFFVSCDQAALWMVLSVCASVPQSYVFRYLPSSCHHGIIRSLYQRQKWCPCKRSRSEVKDPSLRYQNPIEPFPDRNSSLNPHMAMKWSTKLDVAYERCCIVFKVIHQISMSRG